MLTFYPSRIPDPGVKKAPDPGSGSATLVNGLTTGLSGQIPTDGLSFKEKKTENIYSTSFLPQEMRPNKINN